MLSLFRFAYVMAVGRAVSGWRLELVLFGGILLAVSLMASGVIFSDLLANAALRDALARAEPESVNLVVRTFSSQDDPKDIQGRARAFEERDSFVDQNVVTPIRPYLKEHSKYLETATFFFQGRPHLETDRDTRPRGQIYHLTGLEERARVLQGQWPVAGGQSPALAADRKPVDVAVDQLGAELLRMNVGDTMEVFPATIFDDAIPIRVRIAAIFQQTDPDDEFWYGLSYASSKKDDRWTLIPLYTSEEALITGVLGAYPSLYAETTWHLFPDHEKLRAEHIVEIQGLIAQIERAVSVGLKNSSYSIRLDTLLRDFEEELLLARLPLLLMLFLVVGILVYYLSLVAGLIVRSRTVEIAMLKSRGATVWQLGVLGFGEGLLLAIPAAVAGPFLALGLVELLGVIFFRFSGTEGILTGIPVDLSLPAFLLGIAGGALAVLVFTVSTLAASRRGNVEARQSGARPPTSNLLHRYYLDVALLAVIGLVWWQLQSRGAFLVQSLGSSELSIDYTLLLGPVLGLLAAGLIVLRLFPWAAALLARIAEPVGPPWVVHVIRHLSRDPMTPAMLVVLVMLATSLGIMGSVFSTTLERGQRERAMYEAGADLRFQVSPGSISDSLAGRLEGLDGVDGLAKAYRTPAYLTTTGFSTSATLLAVDAESIDGVAWFRNDFADGRSVAELAGLLKGTTTTEGAAPDTGGIPIPADATALSVWARPGGSAQFVSLWARLVDSRGQPVDALVGNLEAPRWERMVLELTPTGLVSERQRRGAAMPEFEPPFTLVSLLMRSGLRENDGGAIFLGEVEALTPQGNILLHDFESTEGWKPVEDFRRPGLYSLEPSRSAAEGRPNSKSDVSGRFSWAPGGVGQTGIRAGGPDEPIPAIVNSEFLEISDADVGDTVVLGMSTHALQLLIVEEIDYFPTLDPRDLPFAVVDLSRLEVATIHYSPRLPRGPNELWLALSLPEGDAPLDSEDVLLTLREEGASVRKALDAPSLVAQRLDTPLVNAGWGALLVLLFLAVSLASASGLMLFSHLDARERQTEFAMLTTLGISQGQMQGVVWAGLFTMVIFGVGLGTLLGWLLGSSLLPLMEVAEEGTRVTPSLLLTADWQRILVSYAILSVVTGLCGLWLTWLTGKLQLHQVLRLGE